MSKDLALREEHTANKAEKFVDAIEHEIAQIKSGYLDIPKARLVLQARNTQLRSVEAVFAAARIGMEMKKLGNKKSGKRS